MRKPNLLKKKLKKGEIVLGTWCILPASSVVNVIAAAGLDFVVIDMEHGPISYETAEEMIRAAESENCSPLIRVPRNDGAEILRALDIGAAGVVVPHVENVEQRKAAVKNIKYFPLGERGLSPYTRAGGYDPEKPEQHAKRENQETLSVLIVEGKEGVDNLDEIVDDKNIDVIYFGLCDLSQALGIPGQLNHPKLRKYVESCVEKVKNKSIAVGAFTSSLEHMHWFKNIGIQFITYSLDSTELCRSFKNIIKEFR